jgi:DNA-binding GntR family transcriptional regulator
LATIELNWEFHATLYQASGLPRLLATIQTLHNNVARYLIIYLGLIKDDMSTVADFIASVLVKGQDSATIAKDVEAFRLPLQIYINQLLWVQ